MGRRGSMGGGRSSSSSSSSGGGLFSSRKAAPAPARAPARSSSTRAAPPPAPQQQAPPPAAAPAAAPSGGGGMLAGLAGTVMQGMAFGTGSAIANRAVDAVVGPRQIEHVHTNQEATPAAAAPAAAAPMGGSQVCGDEYQQFNQCLQQQGGGLDACKFYYDMLSQCQSNDRANSQWS